MQGYCVKCRTKREMKTPKTITMKNGRPATQGVCPVCATKMFKMAPSNRNDASIQYQARLNPFSCSKNWQALGVDECL
jgi:hypothetical protein